MEKHTCTQTDKIARIDERVIFLVDRVKELETLLNQQKNAWIGVYGLVFLEVVRAAFNFMVQ